MSKNIKVFVGMSGGVDSSVTAALLKEQGYDVTGVYMKNWSQDLPGFACPWKEDYQDAKRVAVQLGIPFKMYDFETEYRERVVDYMMEGYKAGITPNPDIMCNQEVKFKLFLETALKDGADMIATGHYARIATVGGSVSRSTPQKFLSGHDKNFVGVTPPATTPKSEARDVAGGAVWGTRSPAALARTDGDDTVSEPASLYTGTDVNKDQSYFLYRVTEGALAKSLMPIGEYEKLKVRELAKKFGLATAEKKDSQGICFVGKVGIKEFLQQFVTTEPGAIVEAGGKVIGEHDGALFYTIGQRHGLDVGGGLPYYVIGKDMAKNEVYVTTDLQDPKLWTRELTITSPHWINNSPVEGETYHVRTRYRAPLINCKVTKDGDKWHIIMTDEVRALTPGQSAVVYEGELCLGGGIVI
jgi:tRNA-specific 2-thiouridylase